MSTSLRRVPMAVSVIVAAVIGSGLAPAAAAAAPAVARSGVSACTGHALKVTVRGGDAGLSHAGFVLLFRNVSSHTCTITGYPGLDALNANGKILRHAKRTVAGYLGGATKVRTITVDPAHYASAGVEWLDINRKSRQCRISHSVAITPANTRHTVRRHAHVGICHLEVHPTVHGRSGDSHH